MKGIPMDCPSRSPKMCLPALAALIMTIGCVFFPLQVSLAQRLDKIRLDELVASLSLTARCLTILRIKTIGRLHDAIIRSQRVRPSGPSQMPTRLST